MKEKKKRLIFFWEAFSNIIVFAGIAGFLIALTSHLGNELRELPIIFKVSYPFAILMILANTLRVNWSMIGLTQSKSKEKGE